MSEKITLWQYTELDVQFVYYHQLNVQYIRYKKLFGGVRHIITVFYDPENTYYLIISHQLDHGCGSVLL
jgi:hypothetical protein